MSKRLEAGRTSIYRYRNSLGLDSRLLGDLDLEHAVGIACLDRFRSSRTRQGETAQERTGGAFDVGDTRGAINADLLRRKGEVQ